MICGWYKVRTPGLDVCEDEVSRVERFLTEGNVIHYDEAMHTVPRDEVVSALQAALSGSQNFEVEIREGTSITIQDLTRNGMSLTSTNFTGTFTVTNAFVVNHPDEIYDVICPADMDVCGVMVPEGSGENSLGHCVLKEDSIPDSCLADEFELSLYVVQGPHFALGVKNDNVECPNIALISRDGVSTSK